MQKPRLLVGALIFGLAISSATNVFADMSSRMPAESSQPRSGWHHSFAQAEAEAKATGKPLLIHFYADWCGPCQVMERNVLSQPGVLKKLGSEVVGVKVNADHHPGLKSQFGVSGFPTDVVVSPDGDVTTRYVGVTTEQGFIARLEREGAKYPKQHIARKPIVTKEESAMVKNSDEEKEDEVLGLNGYSPVALTTGKLWKKGRPEVAAVYRGVIYHFLDEDDRQLFLDDPAKYAPRLLGCDPVILSETGRAVPGQTEHGVFFRNRVYLLATEDNRKTFLKNPAMYADKQYAVEVDEIEQFVSR